jgi:hypothetical protein
MSYPYARSSQSPIGWSAVRLVVTFFLTFTTNTSPYSPKFPLGSRSFFLN